MSTPAQAKSEQSGAQGRYPFTYEVIIEGKTYRLELANVEGRWYCRLDGKEVNIDPIVARPDVMSMIIDNDSYEIKRERTATDLHMWVMGARYSAEVRDPRSFRSRKAGAGAAAGPQKIKAPMPGKVVRILVKQGDEVEVGQGVIVVEAMKMQNEMKATKKGVIKQILAVEGASVTPGEVLAIIE
jgi:biotin carboxyl carrier protein